MKHQYFFSSKDKGKKLKCSLLQLLLRALRAKCLIRLILFPHIIDKFTVYKACVSRNTVELQWLEHLWDYENMFVTGVVRAIQGLL